MNDYATFKSEAETILRPLADTARGLEREIAGLNHRLEVEQGNVGQHERAIVALTDTAGEKAGDQNAFEKFRTALKKRQADLDNTRAVVKALVEVLPGKHNALAAAWLKVNQALMAFAASKRPVAEAAMTAALELVIAEHDGYIAAIEAIAAEHGTVFTPGRRVRPEAKSARLVDVHRHPLGTAALGLTPRPAPVPPPPAPPPAAPGATDAPAPESSTPLDAAPGLVGMGAALVELDGELTSDDAAPVTKEALHDAQ
jgi:hypothetical protein